MLKRSYFNVFTASTLLLGAAFGCGRAPETSEIPPEVAAARSVDYSAAPDGEVALLTSDEKYDEFVKSSPVAVVKFGAQWCPPCRAFEPDLRKQAGYFAGRGVKFAEVDSTNWARRRAISAFNRFRTFAFTSTVAHTRESSVTSRTRWRISSTPFANPRRKSRDRSPRTRRKRLRRRFRKPTNPLKNRSKRSFGRKNDRFLPRRRAGNAPIFPFR